LGTSTNYKAPTTPEWSRVKGLVTRIGHRGTPTDEQAAQIIREFIGANGGARSVARGQGQIGQGKAAQHVLQRLGAFSSFVLQRGLNGTLEVLNLQALAAMDLNDLMLSLTDYLGGPADTIEEIDARNALSRLMDELFADITSIEELEQILNERFQWEDFSNIFKTYFSYYLFEQFARIFYERLVTKIGEIATKAYMNSILDYIKSSVQLLTLNTDISNVDWNGTDGEEMAAQIFEEVLVVFGG